MKSGQSRNWVKTALIKCYAVMQSKIMNTAGNADVGCTYEKEPILLMQGNSFQWKNSIHYDALMGIFRRQRYGCSGSFSFDGITFEELNRSGFFLYNAELLFLASFIFNDTDAFYTYISLQNKKEEKKFVIEKLLDIYGECEDYVWELLEGEAWICEEIISVLECLLYGKKNAVNQQVTVWLSNMKRNLNLNGLPKSMYQYILPDILSAVLDDEMGTFFVFYEPNITRFDELLPHVVANEFTVKMKEARDTLVDCITSSSKVEQMLSDHGYLAWGYWEHLSEEHPDMYLKFPYALFYFQAYYIKWEENIIKKSLC